MRLSNYLIERDIAKLHIEDCAEFSGIEKVKCKIEKYKEYITDIKNAIRTSDSDKEIENLEKSLNDAENELDKLQGEK